MTETISQQDAPHPEDDQKPDSPTQLDKRSWRYIVRRTVREFSADQCQDAAAALTYYAMLSMFPAFIAIFSLLGVFGQSTKAANALVDIIGSVAPGDTAKALRGPIESVAHSPGAGLAVILGVAIALWSASAYVGAFSRAMNRIYEIQEGRPFWKLRPMQLVVTVVTVILVTVAIAALVLSGNVVDAVGSMIGASSAVRIAWNILKWPLLLFIVVFLVALLYYATPNAKQPKFRWISMGALIAIVVLIVGSLAFGIYVVNFSHYNRTYGSLAGVIVFLLWVWIANLALLFGAEFDAEVERGRQLQGGIDAAEEIQLPPRDTRRSDKAAAKRQRDVEEGQRIFRDHED